MDAFISEYIGFWGEISRSELQLEKKFLALEDNQESPIASKTAPGYGIQLIKSSKYNNNKRELLQNQNLFLSGLIESSKSISFLESHFLESIRSQSYEHFSAIHGAFSGCIFDNNKVYLFRSLQSREGLFYRLDSSKLEWATDPSKIARAEDLNYHAISICCRGCNDFVFQNIHTVPPGHIVIIDLYSSKVNTFQFDQYLTFELPKNTNLEDLSSLAHKLMLDATSVLARSGKIGVLLSGGIDSAAVLAALVENGADVVAYHWDIDDKAASEITYARDVCNYLSVKLIAIPAKYQKDYLPISTFFPLPYFHDFYLWYVQVMDKAKEDGVTIMTSGDGGDEIFNGWFSIHNIIKSNIPLSEKMRLFTNSMFTNSSNANLFRKAHRRPSIEGNSIPDEDRIKNSLLRSADFLANNPFQQSRKIDFAPLRYALELSAVKPKGLQTYSPYTNKQLIAFSNALPDAYRQIAIQGQIVTKPILRLAFADLLPSSALKRSWRPWLDSVNQTFCKEQKDILLSLLTDNDSCLKQAGIVLPQQLQKVLQDDKAISANSLALISTSMTEIFLRNILPKL